MAKTIYHVLEDPVYREPYFDVDEPRSRPGPAGEVTYRYFHGGFTGTGVKFSFHFPQPEQFAGRFFQYLSPFPGPEEELASLPKTGEDDVILFSLLHGACFVESNMGSGSAFGATGDDTVRWKSSAAVV